MQHIIYRQPTMQQNQLIKFVLLHSSPLPSQPLVITIALFLKFYHYYLKTRETVTEQFCLLVHDPHAHNGQGMVGQETGNQLKSQICLAGTQLQDYPQLPARTKLAGKRNHGQSQNSNPHSLKWDVDILKSVQNIQPCYAFNFYDITHVVESTYEIMRYLSFLFSLFHST